MANVLINLKKDISAKLETSEQVREFSKKFSDFQDKLPNLLVHLKDLKANYFELRKKISRKLVKQKRKSLLALEHLGWGGIAAFLESAFCGDILDVWG